MKLQDQVITLRQAKRLKELDIAQHASYFAYISNKTEYEPDLKSDDENDYAAFNVAELGVILSKYIRHIYKVNSMHWWIDITLDDNDVIDIYSTEAEARADLLIYLLEKGHITPKQVNETISKQLYATKKNKR